MGGYQPHHTWGKKQRHPHGQELSSALIIYIYAYNTPEDLECVKRVNQIAEDNWKRYTFDEFKELQGHLLKYPVEVDADGNVNPLPGHENFPDVSGRVLGAHFPTIPEILTT